MEIPFQDISRQHSKLQLPTHLIASIVARNACILGEEVSRLEHEIAQYLGCKHAIACSSGTDAIVIALMALDLRPGDGVVCPSFTFVATAGAIALAGGVPVFADIDHRTYNISSDSVRTCIDVCARTGTKIVGVIGVDLYGSPFDRASLRRVCDEHGLWLVNDAAQSFGARSDNHTVASDPSLDVTTTSFYPYKVYGCYGDGGALFTNDDRVARAARSISQHGLDQVDRFISKRVGICGRLDTLQAAVLLSKLPYVDEERKRRNSIATRYDEAFRSFATVQFRPLGSESESAVSVYTIAVPAERRPELCRLLTEAGVGHRIYYRTPIHHQPGYTKWHRSAIPLPNTDTAAVSVLSLPCFAELEEQEVKHVIDSTVHALGLSVR